MADIFHHFTINSSIEKVFVGISTPNGLDKWWTKYSTGNPGLDEKYEHYKISCYCWAMYLRVIKRFIEYGEEVPYEKRLIV